MSNRLGERVHRLAHQEEPADEPIPRRAHPLHGPLAGTRPVPGFENPAREVGVRVAAGRRGQLDELPPAVGTLRIVEDFVEDDGRRGCGSRRLIAALL